MQNRIFEILLYTAHMVIADACLYSEGVLDGNERTDVLVGVEPVNDESHWLGRINCNGRQVGVVVDVGGGVDSVVQVIPDVHSSRTFRHEMRLKHLVVALGLFRVPQREATDVIWIQKPQRHHAYLLIEIVKAKNSNSYMFQINEREDD